MPDVLGRRITPLAEVLVGIARGDFEGRVPRNWSGDEHDALAYLVNNMASEVARLFQEEQASRKYFQALFDGNPDPVFSISSTGSIEDANVAALECWGHTHERIRSLRVSDLFTVDGQRDAGRLLDDPVTEPFVVEIVGQRGDGASFPVRVSWRRVSLGERETVLVVARDITRERESEAKARQADQEIERARRMGALGRIAGGIAHDFNNLLVVVSLSLEEIMDSLDPRDPRFETAETALGAATKGAGLVRQLLDFARVRAPFPETGSVEVGPVLSNLLPLWRSFAGGRITVRLTVEEGLPPCRGSAPDLERALLNLVSNAVKAMPQGGSLDVRAFEVGREDVPTDRIEGDRFVCVEVADTGVGMDQSTLAHVFDPFFTTRSVGEGSGLGLPAAYGIARQYGGVLTASSALGEGASFRLFLPVEEHGATPRA